MHAHRGLAWWLLLLTALVGACGFADGTPDGAIILCADDAGCPGGLVCNLSSHTCVAPDLAGDETAPSVVSVSVAPAHAKDGDTVQIVVSADEALLDAALAFAPGVPDAGFALAIDDDRATFTLVIASSTAPGTTVVDAVVLTDLANNQEPRAVDGLVFRVDRTAPTIVRAAARGAGPDGIVADLSPYTGVEVEVEVDEPLASLSARFQALLDVPAPCVADPEVALGFSCALTASAALPDGDNDVVVEAVDLAGNGSSVAVQIAIDTKAPSPLPGTARVLLLDARGDLSAALLPGGRMEVEFDVDEEVAALPAVTLVSGVGPAATSAPLSVVVAGRRVRAVLANAQPQSAGSGLLKATLADAVGHQQTAPLLLGAPLDVGIPIVTQVPSSCENPAPQGCPDADGDGALGLDDDCVVPPGAELDCDDDNATVSPGGLELPGDGLDNDCLGDGDSPIDEAGWVFVACDSHENLGCVDGTDEGHAGTRADPHLDLIVALADASASGKGVIADGPFRFIAGVDTLIADVPLVGGVSAELGWQRVPVVNGVPLTWVTDLILVDVLSTAGVADVALPDSGIELGPFQSAVRIADGWVGASSGARIIDCQLGGGVGVRVGASDVIVRGGTTGGGVYLNDLSSAVVTGTRSVNAFEAVGGAHLTLVGTEGPVYVSRGRIDAYFARLSTDANDRAARIYGGELHLVDSVLAATSGKILLEVCDDCDLESRWTLDHVKVELASDARAVVRSGSGETVASGAEVVAGTALGCVGVDTAELVEPPATGAMVGADAFARGAPASAVADVEGQCRPAVDGTWPIGP